MKQNLVSIITPVYNARNFIMSTAQSVINQTYQCWEWILIDDCSTDDSWKILNNLSENDKRIKIYRNKTNLSSGKTRNLAIRKAIGRYIAFLDIDDLWHSKKLSIQVSFMLKNKYHFTHTSYGYIDEKGEKIKSIFRVNKEVGYNDLLKRTEIACLTAIYDAKKIGKFYMSHHSRKQDYALWLKILKTGVKCYGIDKNLASYRQVSSSATSKKYKLVFKHITFLKETQNFGLLKSIYYTIHWIKNGIIRYYIK